MALSEQYEICSCLRMVGTVSWQAPLVVLFILSLQWSFFLPWQTNLWCCWWCCWYYSGGLLVALRCSMSPSCRDWQIDVFDHIIVVVVVVVDAFLQFSMSCKDWQADWGTACQSVKLKICWMVDSSPAAQHSGIHAKGGTGWVVQFFFWYFFPTPNT